MSADDSKVARHRPWLWKGAAALVLLGMLALLAIGRQLGHFLIVEDAPQKVRAIVVLGGHLPFRALEAATAYHEGWAEEVWLTQGGFDAEEQALERLEIEYVPEHEYSRRVLIAKGVPEAAIRILPERNAATADEIASVARHLRRARDWKVMIVTSKFHTRRVKLLWRMLAPDETDAILRYTDDDLFDAAGWWRNTGDAMALAREYFGMLNAWAGFPISTER